MKVIGVGGFARAGKDTFVKIACDILKKNGYTPFRIAFADILKEEVQVMLNENNFKLDVYTDDPQEKQKIRPLLVWWGCARRDLSEGGLYWVDYAKLTMEDYIDDGEDVEKKVFLISDVRFPNEAKWVHENNGWFIHLKRYIEREAYNGICYGPMKEKVFDKAPNEEEAKQDPLIQEMADAKLEWGSKEKLTPDEAAANPELRRIVFEALKACPYFSNDSIHQ